VRSDGIQRTYAPSVSVCSFVLQPCYTTVPSTVQADGPQATGQVSELSDRVATEGNSESARFFTGREIDCGFNGTIILIGQAVSFFICVCCADQFSRLGQRSSSSSSSLSLGHVANATDVLQP
jgi:hypothetical protein